MKMKPSSFHEKIYLMNKDTKNIDKILKKHVSISSTFFAQIFQQYFGTKKLQSPNLTREKLCEALLYKKYDRKILIKSTHCGLSQINQNLGCCIQILFLGVTFEGNIVLWSFLRPNIKIARQNKDALIIGPNPWNHAKLLLWKENILLILLITLVFLTCYTGTD